MIYNLIKLATHLDLKGLHKEADYLDMLIKKAAEKGVSAAWKRLYELALDTYPHPKSQWHPRQPSFAETPEHEKLYDALFTSGYLDSSAYNKALLAHDMGSEEDILKHYGVDSDVLFEALVWIAVEHDMFDDIARKERLSLELREENMMEDLKRNYPGLV